MKQVEKLKVLSKSVLNDKDYQLILKFIKDHDFDSFSEIIKSEIKKEGRNCVGSEATSRYIILHDINFILAKFDLSEFYMDKCANYEEE